MSAAQHNVIHTLVSLNAKLLEAAQAQDANAFIRHLIDVERCVRYSREQLQRTIIIDPQEVDDDEM